MSTLLQDLRFGLRMLAKNPGFTVVAVLTLALGIGANTAIFTIIDAALLRPLPYAQPEQLVDISSMHLNGNPEVIAPDYRIWQEQSKDFEAMGAFGRGFNGYSDAANLTGAGEPVRVKVVPVTTGFFSMLKVQPLLGRTFSAEEGQPGHNRVALVSAAVWRQQFAGDRSVLYRSIYLDQTPYTVIGVMPAGLLYPPGDLWVPEVLDSSNSLPGNFTWPMLYVIGRLKPGVSAATAGADLEVLSHRLDPQFSPGRRAGHAHLRVEVIPLRQLLVGDTGRLLLILLAAVAFVLLIACANVANLLLSRAATRIREVAVRAALGARRSRLVGQFLTESLTLALLGGGLGLLAGLAAARALKNLVPPQLPNTLRLDWRVLVFTIAATACVVIFSGMAPTVIASRVELGEMLKEGGAHAGRGRATHQLRALLVISQMALALVLLTGAGLLGRSLERLSEVNLGFDPHHLLLAEVWLPISMPDEPRQHSNFFRAALERIRALPGVETASATTHYPVSIFNELTAGMEVRGGQPPQRTPPISVAYISPGYFRTIGTRVLKGRDFDDLDVRNSRDVVILSARAARNAFGDHDPIGSEINFDGRKARWRTVVGVVADTRNFMLEREPWPEIFVPFEQQPSAFMTFVVRTGGPPLPVAKGVIDTVHSIALNQPVSGVQTMDEVVQKVVTPREFKLLLLGSFAALALILSAIGLYGVMSYAVSERTHEIGVRVALGAERRDVLRFVAMQGLKWTLMGMVLGVGGALELTRYLASLLYGIPPTDPLTFVAVASILFAVALLACYLPARRATKVDPVEALRYE